jgi:hypothetical protein
VLTVPKRLAELETAAAALAELDPDGLSDAVLVDGLERLGRIESMVRAAQTSWLRVAMSRDATVAETGRSARSFLVEDCGYRPSEAGRRCRLAGELAGASRLESAFAAGDVTADHAITVLDALRVVDAGSKDTIEQILVDLAEQSTPNQVAVAVDEVLVRYGAAEDADAAYARRHAERGVQLATTMGGSGSLSGTLTPEATETLRLALQAAAGVTGGGDAGGGTDGDDRTPAARRHDALAEIASFYLTHAENVDPVAGERPRVVVTMTYESLLRQLDAANDSSALLDSGVTIGPETARRLACDAEIIPAVLGSRSEPLDLGRASRSFSTSIRRAAALRQQNGCAYPGCQRPIRECHHIKWWSKGGPTSLGNAAWLCAFHHWLVHEGHWSMRLNADHTFTFTDPIGREHGPPGRPEAA